jgi:hypothetical protein
VLLDEKQRESRVHDACQNIHSMLKNLVSGPSASPARSSPTDCPIMFQVLTEEEMALRVEKDIASRRRTVQEMRSSFKMPAFDESPYPSGSINLVCLFVPHHSITPSMPPFSCKRWSVTWPPCRSSGRT